jgi:hypothetical protein
MRPTPTALVQSLSARIQDKTCTFSPISRHSWRITGSTMVALLRTGRCVNLLRKSVPEKPLNPNGVLRNGLGTSTKRP